MLQALTNPERASYDTLQGALERWKALRSRYDRKKDQFGSREALPESLAMSALEKLVPKELETHLMLNYARFKTFEEMEREVINFMEAKTGSRMVVSSNFAKPSGGNSGPVPMDVDSLDKVVSGNLASIVKKGGKGDGKGNANKIKFDGTCDNCGKYGHRKHDCWSKPTGAGKGSTSRSPTSSPKKEVKFTGTCNHCGKPGHKKAECWAAQGKGKGGKELNTQWKQKNIDLEESEPSNINQDKIDQKRRGEFGGRQVADVHKILVSAAKLHEKGHTSWIVPGGGEIIPLNHPVSKAMIAAYHKAVDEFGKMGIIPDRKTGMMMATALNQKGAVDTTGQKLLTRFLELLGYKDIVLKSDGEHSLVRMKKAAGRDAKNLVKTICEESPAGDSRANGEAEAAVREVKWRIKAVHLMLEKKIEGGLPGKKWIKPMPVFGEKIFIKPAGKGKKSDASKMKEARFLGCHNRFGSVLGMTKEGVLVGTGFHTVAEGEKWGPLELDLKGAPWDVRAYVRRLPDEPIPAPSTPAVVVVPSTPMAAQGLPGDAGLTSSAPRAEEEAPAATTEAEVGGPSTSPQTPTATRAWPVRREHLVKFGRTAECPGCLSILKGAGFQQVAHNEACRSRIKKRLVEEQQAKAEETKRRLSDFKRDKKMVQEMIERKDTYLVQSPMCKFGMKMDNDAGERCYVRKETLWLTNSKHIAEELEGVCINKLKGREVHRHVHLIGRDRAKAAQVYPVPLVEAILRGLKKELVNNQALSAVEELLNGPSPDNGNEMDMELKQWEEEQYMDDVSGALLDPELVKKARELELQWLKKEEVYIRVPRREATGKLLQWKWIDVNKGDNENPFVRSRMVAKEIKKAKPVEMQLGGADTFSATPPIEAVYTLLSAFMSKDPKKGELKLANWDISRAHFMGRAARDIFMELPEQDMVPTDQEPMVAKLMRSMYGTQDASKIFQEDYQEWLKQNGGTFCPLCPAIFRFEERGLLGLVHGDDFLVVGEDAQLRWLDDILNKKYTAKWENLVGDGPGDKKSMTFLNRLIKYIPDGTDQGGRRLEIEADARHAEILLREFGFNKSTKGCDVPEDKMTQAELVEADRQPVLESKQVSLYRSMVMRMAYMSSDRPDLCHVVRTLASAMKSPKMVDWQRLKKAVRYLVKVPYPKRVFHEQPIEKFSGGLVKGIMAFWGFETQKVKLMVDSSAAKAMAERKGVGVNRHVQARYLWLQDKVFNKELEVNKVPGKINDADLVTKVQPKSVILAHLARPGFENSGREGHKGLT
ncbi:unnamed protein product [Durusdinium trenchii]|uniref:CCHC-type domain-containing protein n=1 Tax=Durusdinium trenchii TaxID=1381693 RepID=A0ABP0SNJ7_9DINO